MTELVESNSVGLSFIIFGEWVSSSEGSERFHTLHIICGAPDFFLIVFFFKSDPDNMILPEMFCIQTSFPGISWTVGGPAGTRLSEQHLFAGVAQQKGGSLVVCTF